MQRELYILGGSGHALVVLELAALNNWPVEGYFDLQPSAILPASVPYMGKETADVFATHLEAVFFPAIGDNASRAKVLELLESADQQTVLVHPRAAVSESATVGSSVMIGANAVVNPHAVIGKGTIVNSGAVVEHECEIGQYVHIAPGATVLGNVKIGSGSFVGANAVIKQGVAIGAKVVIGAGSVVLKDVPDGCTVVGNPAKILER